MPVNDPPTAADRSGKRSPPMATIIGNTGPEATPAAKKAAIASGRLGASEATAMVTPIAIAQTIVKRRWSKRSAITEETRRPTVRPAQNRDSASVAVVSGAGSRKATTQFETPTSAAT